MLTCPMCKQKLVQLDRECPRCRADLSLLVDYVGHLDVGLSRADRLTCAGHLGDAVWAYLEVLEVDPDQPTARSQVGQVAAAVRQFDRSAPGRRWLKRLQRQARFRHWLTSWDSESPAGRWLRRRSGSSRYWPLSASALWPVIKSAASIVSNSSPRKQDLNNHH